MSFSTFAEDDTVMSEINMTPLVDVMLVLLIIFMITVPVIRHSVKLDLPHATNQTHDVKPAHINVIIKQDGNIRWNGISIQSDELPDRIAVAAHQHPQPELHLYADRQTTYEHVARLMAAAQSGGLAKIGFVTNPGKSP